MLCWQHRFLLIPRLRRRQRGGAAAADRRRRRRQAAPIDMTGYWVSVVTEDWKFRMVTPPKGNYAGVPLNAAGRKVADSVGSGEG